MGNIRLYYSSYERKNTSYVSFTRTTYLDTPKDPETSPGSTSSCCSIGQSTTSTREAFRFYFPSVNMVGKEIKKITLKHRITTDAKMSLKLNGSTIINNIAMVAQSNLNKANAYKSIEIPDSYWNGIIGGLTGTNYVSVEISGTSGYGSKSAYVWAVVFDIEYDEIQEDHKIKIGANNLKRAVIGSLQNIVKIFKGSELLFEYKLPSAYQEVEYIRSFGAQYINTDLYGKAGLKTYAKLKLHGGSSDTATLLGERDAGSSATRYYIGYRQYNGTVNIGYETEYTSLSVPTADTLMEYEYDIGNDYLLVKENGTTIINESGTNSFTTSYPLYMFAQNTAGTASAHMNCSLYRLKIWDNNILIRDYVPCYRKSDNVVGLYDMISGTFYTNQGSGSFITGPAIITLPDAYQKVEYVNFTGNNTGASSSPYIDTGIVPTGTMSFYIDMDCIGASGCTGWGTGADSAAIIFRGEDSTTFKVQSDGYSEQRYTISGRHLWLVDYQNGKMGHDGTVVSISTSVFPLINFYLGAWHEGSSVYYGLGGPVYSFRVYNSGALIANYIPCYRISDNVIGFYDTVSKTFKINNGSGSFTKGPDAS